MRVACAWLFFKPASICAECGLDFTFDRGNSCKKLRENSCNSNISLFYWPSSAVASSELNSRRQWCTRDIEISTNEICSCVKGVPQDSAWDGKLLIESGPYLLMPGAACSTCSPNQNFRYETRMSYMRSSDIKRIKTKIAISKFDIFVWKFFTMKRQETLTYLNTSSWKKILWVLLRMKTFTCHAGWLQFQVWFWEIEVGSILDNTKMT